MGFIKTGDVQPIMEIFDTPNRKREFSEDGSVVYSDINEAAGIEEVINETSESEKKD